MLTVADWGRGSKICQNLTDVICERSLIRRNARRANFSFLKSPASCMIDYDYGVSAFYILLYLLVYNIRCPRASLAECAGKARKVSCIQCICILS